MDDVVKPAAMASSLPDDLASTPTPTNVLPPSPFSFQRQTLSMSVPTSPIMIKKQGLAGSDDTTPTATGPASISEGMVMSSSCSRLQDHDPESGAPEHRAENSFLLSRLPEADKLDEILREEKEEPEFTPVHTPTTTSKKKKESINSTHPQYFSEPEMSPGTSPMVSRPESPILSDSEFESRKREAENQDQNEQSWEWGKLPTPSTPEARAAAAKKAAINKEAEEAKATASTRGWGLSYLWRGSGNKQSKSGSPSKNDKVPEAIYLEDLKDDEEMLKIYVGSHLYNRNTPSKTATHPMAIEDDAESGKGASLPMSPHSVEGAIGGTLNSQMVKYEEYENRNPVKVEVSLCGGLESPQGFSTTLFEQGKLSFDDFAERLKIEDSNLFNNPDLVVRIEDQYYTWQAACPIIMSKVLYGRSLPSELVDVVAASYQESQQLINSSSTATTSVATATTTSSTSTAVATTDTKKSSWWPFGSKRGEPEEGMPKEKEEAAQDKEVGANKPEESATSPEKSPRKPRSAVNLSSSSDCSTGDELLASIVGQASGRYKKTLRLSNELIAKLNLKSGSNEVQFSVTTAFQGTTRCNCHVYLWKWTDKIVISDIDGTITKSDVLGHVLPIIGRDWAQSGVASLFTKIKNNGYHIAYLSARAIGQASITKDYLQSVTQGDVNLPDGPLLLNPTSLVNAFHREVIIKKPEDFKIACLRDIQKLFPAFQTEDGNPFYAGYGNRVNDVWAYGAVQIPVSRIFTINPKGELRHALTQTYQASYCSQATMVDHIFPPLDALIQPVEVMRYSTFSFWREPLPEIEIENVIKKADQGSSTSATVSAV